MTDPTHTPENDLTLAGELALRLLSPEDERAALARAASDPVFAREVEAWNNHLVAFTAEVPAVAPAAGVWAQVQANIAPAANDNGRVGFWRAWAVGSTGLLAASLVAVAVLLGRQGPTPAIAPPEAPDGAITRVATLTLSEGGGRAMILAYDTVTGSLYLAPTSSMSGAQGVPHLWLVKPEGGVQLIGAIDGEGVSRHTLPETLAGQAGSATAVAISMEAPGHTPGQNRPDGPVVASGELQQL